MMVGSLTTQVKTHTNNNDFDLMTRLIIRFKKNKRRNTFV